MFAGDYGMVGFTIHYSYKIKFIIKQTKHKLKWCTVSDIFYFKENYL